LLREYEREEDSMDDQGLTHVPKDMIVNEISLVIQNKVPKNKNKDKN
jgi:hypothetical protein